MTHKNEANIREFLGTKVGEASMCWNPRPSSEVFDSTQASKIVDQLLTLFSENIEVLHDDLTLATAKECNLRVEAARLRAALEFCRGRFDSLNLKDDQAYCADVLSEELKGTT